MEHQNDIDSSYKDIHAPKKQNTARTGKVKFLKENEVIKLASGSLCMTRTTYVGPKKDVPKVPFNVMESNPCISPRVHGKLQSNEAQKNQQRNQHVSHLSYNKGPRNEYIPEKFFYYHKHLPSSVCTWRGEFHVLQAKTCGKVYDGFEAQFPCIVNRKAREISKKIPSFLRLEALPASNVLTDIFPKDPPSLLDIALYFFPSNSKERSRLNLNSLFELMYAKKLVLRSFIDGGELFLFTSSELNDDSRGTFATVYSENFLWGVFRQNKTDNTIEVLHDMVEPIDMDIDMIGGKDVLERMDHVQNEKLKWSFDIQDVPPGFEEFGHYRAKNLKYKR